MRFSFELEVTLLRVFAIVVLEGALDINGMCVRALRSNCCSSSSLTVRDWQARTAALWQGTPETGVFLNEFKGEIDSGQLAGASYY